MSTLRSTSLESPVLVKRIGPAKMVAIAGGLVLAAAVGYAINGTETKPMGAAAFVPQSQTADFLRWNTTALEFPIPAVGQSSARGDAFIAANTTALDRLVPAVGQSSMRGDAFIAANTTDLEYPTVPYTERWNGPR